MNGTPLTRGACKMECKTYDLRLERRYTVTVTVNKFTKVLRIHVRSSCGEKGEIR